MVGGERINAHRLGGPSPLLSGWTFGDFSLSLRWNVVPGASLLISLPEVSPKGTPIQLRLAEAGKAGTLKTGEATMPTPATQSLPDGTMHTARTHTAK